MIIRSLTNMRRVFNNLVENAVARVKEIVVRVERSSREIICVDAADDGPEIAAGGMERVLAPFVRGESPPAIWASMAASGTDCRSCAHASKRWAIVCNYSTESRVA